MIQRVEQDSPSASTRPEQASFAGAGAGFEPHATAHRTKTTLKIRVTRAMIDCTVSRPLA